MKIYWDSLKNSLVQLRLFGDPKYNLIHNCQILNASIIAHELEPKKMGIWLRRVDKTQRRFLVTSGCLLSRKVWWAVQIGSFWRKIEVFYRPEWTKKGGHMKMNFEYFQIWKWMLQTVRAEIALTDLGFLLRSAQSCKKCTFLGKWRTITQKGNMKTWQMTPFFHLLFLLKLFVTSIFVFENSQNSFSCAPPFVHSGL